MWTSKEKKSSTAEAEKTAVREWAGSMEKYRIRRLHYSDLDFK